MELSDALAMIEAAQRRAAELGVAETICVCDDGGHPIALHRMDGAGLTGGEISMAKALTAGGHQRPTQLLTEPPDGRALPGNEAGGIHVMSAGRFATYVGGLPIVVDDRVVGGIGISGGNQEQDRTVGQAALDALDRRRTYLW